MPTAARGTAATLIARGGERWLVDCGEGTQRQLLRSGLGLVDLDLLLITHLHGDHYLGPARAAEDLRAAGARAARCASSGPRGLSRLMEVLRPVVGRTPFVARGRGARRALGGRRRRGDGYRVEHVPDAPHGPVARLRPGGGGPRPGAFDVAAAQRARRAGGPGLRRAPARRARSPPPAGGRCARPTCSGPRGPAAPSWSPATPSRATRRPRGGPRGGGAGARGDLPRRGARPRARDPPLAPPARRRRWRARPDVGPAGADPPLEPPRRRGRSARRPSASSPERPGAARLRPGGGAVPRARRADRAPGGRRRAPRGRRRAVGGTCYRGTRSTFNPVPRGRRRRWDGRAPAPAAHPRCAHSRACADKVLVDADQVRRTVARIAHEIVERHPDPDRPRAGRDPHARRAAGRPPGAADRRVRRDRARLRHRGHRALPRRRRPRQPPRRAAGGGRHGPRLRRLGARRDPGGRRPLHRAHHPRRHRRDLRLRPAARWCSSPCWWTAATASCRSGPTTSGRTCRPRAPSASSVRLDEMDGADEVVLEHDAEGTVVTRRSLTDDRRPRPCGDRAHPARRQPLRRGHASATSRRCRPSGAARSSTCSSRPPRAPRPRSSWPASASRPTSSTSRARARASRRGRPSRTRSSR